MCLGLVQRNLFSDVVHNFQDSSSRPLNMREIKEEAKDIIYMDEINHECTLACPPGPPQSLAKILHCRRQ